MEKKPIFNFGIMEKQCRVQIIETSPRSIVNVVRAEAILASIVDSCKKVTKAKDGSETVTYSTFRLQDSMIEKLATDVLPILSDLVSGFES